MASGRRGAGGRTVVALALAIAGTSCGHDWSVADGADSDTVSPPDDGDGSSHPDGDSETLPDFFADDAPVDADAPGDDAVAPDDAAPDGPPPTCGNGAVDPGEECDPGGPTSVRGCDSDCTAAECGDGVLGILEGWTDGFESGSPASPPWENGTPYGFEATSLVAHAGTYSLGSTNAGARRTTAWIRLQAAGGDTVCFWYMGEPCSSREDEFRFLVDGAIAFSTSAPQLTWVQQCVPVTPGLHTFEWRYAKGRSDACSGLDAFHINDIDTGGPFDEECDDGNDSNTDACTGGCRAATCGDGYIWAGVEECEGATASCSTLCGSLGTQPCSACTYLGACTPPAEVCNGADDDCDRLVDEGYDCSPGDATGCTNACGAAGTQTCGGSCTWGACCAATEFCDCGVCDDNCDGVTDEGCPIC